MKKKNGIYSESFKRRVVLEVLSGSITKEGARLRYGIGGNSTILEWMRSYVAQKSCTFGDPLTLTPERMTDCSDKLALEERIRALEAELEYLRLKSRAYEILVDIAERDFNLDLKKKHGAKQLASSKRSTPR